MRRSFKRPCAVVADVVRKQVEVGIDIPNDGEYARRGFTSYIHERLGGLAPRPIEPGDKVMAQQDERVLFPEFFAQYDRHARTLWMAPGISLEGMVDMIAAQHSLSRLDALALASVTVDMRITQIVNKVRGVHAFLPHEAITLSKN